MLSTYSHPHPNPPPANVVVASHVSGEGVYFVPGRRPIRIKYPTRSYVYNAYKSSGLQTPYRRLQSLYDAPSRTVVLVQPATKKPCPLDVTTPLLSALPRGLPAGPLPLLTEQPLEMPLERSPDLESDLKMLQSEESEPGLMLESGLESELKMLESEPVLESAPFSDLESMMEEEAEPHDVQEQVFIEEQTHETKEFVKTTLKRKIAAEYLADQMKLPGLKPRYTAIKSDFETWFRHYAQLLSDLDSVAALRAKDKEWYHGVVQITMQLLHWQNFFALMQADTKRYRMAAGLHDKYVDLTRYPTIVLGQLAAKHLLSDTADLESALSKLKTVTGDALGVCSCTNVKDQHYKCRCECPGGETATFTKPIKNLLSAQQPWSCPISPG